MSIVEWKEMGFGWSERAEVEKGRCGWEWKRIRERCVDGENGEGRCRYW